MDDLEKIFPKHGVEHWDIKAVEREKWLALLESAKDAVAEQHQAKWKNLKVGAKRAVGHKELYLNKADYELIESYAKGRNDKIQRSTRQGVGGKSDLSDNQKVQGGKD